ncbi:MAG: hypothetical protein V2A66_04055 [Pseudomonadota bacterium]
MTLHMMTDSAVASRPPNWLPVPGDKIGSLQEFPHVDESDLFPKGEIASYYPQQGYGYIRTARGQSLIFRVAEMDLAGPKRHRRYIAAGCRVGYDVSWTSHGLRVSRMKIY